MKKYVFLGILASIFFIGLYFASCSSEELNSENAITSMDNDVNDQLDSRTWPGWPKIIFKFKHRGMTGSNCDYGICGRCLGICFKIVAADWTSQNIVGEPDLGEAYTNVDMQNNTLTLVPTSPVDDGGGVIVVPDDVTISSTLAAAMGYNSGSFTVKSGTYSIDYRTYTYGEIDFDIE